MDRELQRQRAAQFRAQRERYLQTRQQRLQPALISNRKLISTRHRHLPALLVAPFALLAAAGSLDLLFLVTGNGFWTLLSFTMIPAGIVGCVVSAAIGLHDWFIAPPGSRVRGFGIWFTIGAALVVAVFTQSWVARFGIADDAGGLGVVLGFMGAALALLTGLLLGEYLDRLAALTPAEAPEPAVVDQIATPQRVEEIIEQRQVAHA
ncbi:MAG TPA: DUF2231 domain-containing protein [Thermomicrobiales bacterium]|nr:DUF2231 domain-containing protein [Thermomicrobiales bacterium]